MLPSEWKREIININREVDWVNETSAQLIKDFTMLNLDLHLDNENDYKTLFVDAREIIKDLYLKRYSDFLHLLYRIDLPESYVNDMMGAYRGDELYDKLTSQILMREFLKVVNRYRYAL